MNIMALAIAFVCGALVSLVVVGILVGWRESDSELRIKCDLLERRLDELSK